VGGLEGKAPAGRPSSLSQPLARRRRLLEGRRPCCPALKCVPSAAFGLAEGTEAEMRRITPWALLQGSVLPFGPPSREAANAKVRGHARRGAGSRVGTWRIPSPRSRPGPRRSVVVGTACSGVPAARRVVAIRPARRQRQGRAEMPTAQQLRAEAPSSTASVPLSRWVASMPRRTWIVCTRRESGTSGGSAGACAARRAFASQETERRRHLPAGAFVAGDLLPGSARARGAMRSRQSRCGVGVPRFDREQ